MNRRAPSIKIQAFLANLPMFSEMSPDELDRIAATTMPLHAEKGQTICHCGRLCGHLDTFINVLPWWWCRRDLNIEVLNWWDRKGLLWGPWVS